MFDFDYFGDKGTTDYNHEKEYYLQEQHKRSKGTIQPRLQDRNDYFLVQEPSQDQIDLSYDKARRITQKRRETSQNKPGSKSKKAKGLK